MSTDRLIDLSIRAFSERLASVDPAPGGGSASAVAGALAAGLAAMVARLTIGREKYAAHQDEMQQVLAQAERLRAQMLALVDADTAAYQNVMEAYRLPKGDAAQLAARKAAIQEALMHAADIPLAAAEASVQVLNLAALAAQHGNKNAASDASVAALLAHASLHGAARNVRINLEQIVDKQFCSSTELRLSGVIENGEAALRRALAA